MDDNEKVKKTTLSHSINKRIDKQENILSMYAQEKRKYKKEKQKNKKNMQYIIQGDSSDSDPIKCTCNKTYQEKADVLFLYLIS